MRNAVILALALSASSALAASEQSAVFLDGFESGDASRWEGEWSYPVALDTPAPDIWLGSAVDLDDDAAGLPVVGLGGDYAIAAAETTIAAGSTALWRLGAATPTTATLAVFAWEPSGDGRSYYLVAEWAVDIPAGTTEFLRSVPGDFHPSLAGLQAALYVWSAGTVAWTVAGVR